MELCKQMSQHCACKLMQEVEMKDITFYATLLLPKMKF